MLLIAPRVTVFGEDYPSETFRMPKKNELKAFGEYRTQRLVLEAWDRLVQSESDPATRQKNRRC